MEKNIFKIGEMLIDNKQIFWKMKHCYALIPIVQLLDGRTPPSTQMSSSYPKDKSQNSHNFNPSKCLT